MGGRKKGVIEKTRERILNKKYVQTEPVAKKLKGLIFILEI